MPEYRQDPLTGRTVIIAEERLARPHQFDIESIGSENGDGGYRKHCPFCEGNEHQTPGELAAFRAGNAAPDTAGWTVRVVPNKFPAVARNDAEYPDSSTFLNKFPMYPCHPDLFHCLDETDLASVPGIGHHEVIIDTPRHILSVADMMETEVVDMFRMYGERLRTLRAEGRWAYVLIFKNVGAAAGASLPHSHSQLMALPFVPVSIRTEELRAHQYYEKARQDHRKDACCWCDMLREEIREGKRIVEETENFVTICPFVSRFPAETAVYPKFHEPFFDATNVSRLAECAKLVRRTVLRLEKAASWMKGRLAYNIILQSGPFPDPASRNPRTAYHFHLSILPSLARAAGFEWGTGLHINPISPETAAKKLRGEG